MSAGALLAAALLAARAQASDYCADHLCYVVADLEASLTAAAHAANSPHRTCLP